MIKIFRAILNGIGEEERATALLVNKVIAAGGLIGFVAGLYRMNGDAIYMGTCFLIYSCMIAWASYPAQEKK